jgi:hypothetical protein
VKPRGFHYEQSSGALGQVTLSEPQRRIAAYVVQLIHEQLGVDMQTWNQRRIS